MTLAAIDFQAITHQHVTQLIEGWREAGLSDTDIQEAANRFFQFGMIAAQQLQQEGGVQPEGATQKIDYTPEMAISIIRYFLDGINHGFSKALDYRIPSQEKWYLLQQVAMHVFESSKHCAVITMDQDKTPDLAIPDDQLQAMQAQTAVEALLYYMKEYEKQNGPILPESNSESDKALKPEPQEELSEPEPQPEPIVSQVQPEQIPVAEPVQVAPLPPVEKPVQAPLPEIHHKYAAVGLLLNNLSAPRQQQILAPFSPQERDLIAQYRDPTRISQQLEMRRVQHYLNELKANFHVRQAASPAPASAPSALLELLQAMPAERLAQLFASERPILRLWVEQLKSQKPVALPAGIQESLVHYIQRNLPQEVA